MNSHKEPDHASLAGRIAAAANLPTAPRGDGLALFDLDHTLLPIDSDYEWGRFLVRIGVLDSATHERENQRFYRQYHEGTLDIAEYLAFALQPLARSPRAEVLGWHQQFMAEVVQPALRPEAFALVQHHLDAGHLCAVVTATNAFVTRPIAHALGFEHLVATEVEEQDGQYTGRSVGTASFRAGKVVRTQEWLGTMAKDLASFERTWFYSDSMNDLPLLKAVTNPVATNPDARLRVAAQDQGWPILQLFE